VKRFSILLGLMLLAATNSWAGDISVDHAWARASAGNNGAGAVFLTLQNNSKDADNVLSASTPVAKVAELHTHSDMNGVMTMRKVESISINGGQTIELKPGGLHIMLFSMQKQLQEGDDFPVTLTFEKSPPVTVTVKVAGVASMSGHNHMEEHHHMGEGSH
jgi:hypothetical protein